MRVSRITWDGVIVTERVKHREIRCESIKVWGDYCSMLRGRAETFVKAHANGVESRTGPAPKYAKIHLMIYSRASHQQSVMESQGAVFIKPLNGPLQVVCTKSRGPYVLGGTDKGFLDWRIVPLNRFWKNCWAGESGTRVALTTPNPDFTLSVPGLAVPHLETGTHAGAYGWCSLYCTCRMAGSGPAVDCRLCIERTTVRLPAGGQRSSGSGGTLECPPYGNGDAVARDQDGRARPPFTLDWRQRGCCEPWMPAKTLKFRRTDGDVGQG